MKKDLFTRKNY